MDSTSSRTNRQGRSHTGWPRIMRVAAGCAPDEPHGCKREQAAKVGKRAVERSAACTPPDRQCFDRLLQTWQALVTGYICPLEEARLVEEYGTDIPRGKAEKFLPALEWAQNQFDVPPASRAYREKFPSHYRDLFLGSARDYRADMFEHFNYYLESHSVHGHPIEDVSSTDEDDHTVAGLPAIYANGGIHVFSVDAARGLSMLECAIRNLGSKLLVCNAHAKAQRLATKSLGLCMGTQQLKELEAALHMVDQAYAVFEQKYITDCISFEAPAKELLAAACEQERRLTCAAVALAPRPQNPHGARERTAEDDMRRRLCQSISNLNVVANVNRKGRDDLTPEVLESAAKAVRCFTAVARCEDGRKVDYYQPVRLLGDDVFESFQAMRTYLSEVRPLLETKGVNPQLNQNVGLNRRLEDWEETWELGQKYLRNEANVWTLCGFIEKLRGLAQRLPHFSKMCGCNDAELFLVLPRLLWLCFLEEPDDYGRFLQTMLPDRFDAQEGLARELQQPSFGDAFFRLPGNASQGGYAGYWSEAIVSRDCTMVLWPDGTTDSVKLDGSSIVLMFKGKRYRGMLQAGDAEISWNDGEVWERRQPEDSKFSSLLGSRTARPPVPKPELKELIEQYDAVAGLMKAADMNVWNAMACRAVVGAGKAAEAAAEGRGGADAIVRRERFMRDLEAWSIELQRTCPQDWNTFTSLALDCLACARGARGERGRPRPLNDKKTGKLQV